MPKKPPGFIPVRRTNPGENSTGARQRHPLFYTALLAWETTGGSGQIAATGDRGSHNPPVLKGIPDAL